MEMNIIALKEKYTEEEREIEVMIEQDQEREKTINEERNDMAVYRSADR